MMQPKHQPADSKKTRFADHGWRSLLLVHAVAATVGAFLRRCRYPLTLAVAFFICFFLMYTYSQRQTSWIIYWFDDWVFYADASGSYDHMKEISFDGNMWRHPLYPLIVSPLVSGIKAVFGFGNRQAAKVVVALLASLNGALFFTLLHCCFRGKITAIVFACLYGVLFSNLVFFSIPETYSLANLGILVFFLLIIRYRFDITKKRAVILGIASGVGALANPPLGLLLFSVYALCLRRLTWIHSLHRCLWATLTALLVYLGANFLLFGLDYFEKSQKLANKWATMANFFEPANWLNVAVSFFVYAVISPLDELERSIGLKDFSGYFQSPLRTLVFAIFMVFLVFAIFRLARRGVGDIVLTAAAWLAVLSIFHLYFNPREALLYSCQAMGPFMLILGRVFADISWKWKGLAAGIFTIGLGYVNFKCFMG
ncbi:MAG: hypothetical protein JSW26_26790 [Desulfobacterales bacterium]|nr:MAG: hypothetical protein JSW26_26790 [Desulfobacterales bacterium]